MRIQPTILLDKMKHILLKGEQGARSLPSHQCGPGVTPGLGFICGLSLLLVLALAPRVFLNILRFSSLHKNQHFKFKFDPETMERISHSLLLFIYFYFYLFAGFDNTCDLSAVLGILENASIFHTRIQKNAKDVRSKVRNEWGHCNFDYWTSAEFNNSFQFMETLIRSLGLPRADMDKELDSLHDWETKGE